ncbi:MAG: AlwI family type II restriction endonuclease [Gammaproteobacteria bacterium]|nr:AlwI family type II restriction endonuclease [Gammaproteobacteria bacterium]MYF01824.1 AlwI family type II restriction endonuclease [Gammaproteobacteria bacterium]MYI76581.1 AlwI family type II restriction endonuclease [Gammaproteobacteria bacterium]
MVVWHIGNTTVRTPYRLRDALQALQHSSLNGNLEGREQENAFASLLHENGILVAPRVRAGEDASDLGRKWRSALSQLGLITPNLPSPVTQTAIDGCELSGRAYEITPSGHRLIASKSVGAQQECFLRCLLSYRIPSVIEDRYAGKFADFSPLQFVLDTFAELGNQNLEQKLSFQEFALFIQTSSPDNGVKPIVLELGGFRAGLANSINRRQYANEVYEGKSRLTTLQTSTLDDYADLSFRYLKATGLFRAAGRGIVLSPMREKLVEFLRSASASATTDESYLRSLWMGTDLPTDDKQHSHQLIVNLISKLELRGIKVDLPSASIPKRELDEIRYELEKRISEINEREYAKKQSAEVGNIVRLIDAIGANKLSVTLQDSTRFTIVPRPS